MIGLNDFQKEDRPPVAATFWTFRLMVALGMFFCLIALLAFFIRNSAKMSKTILTALVWTIPLPYFALALGWAVAEIGRQPWIVYGLMRTQDGVSPIAAQTVTASLIAFFVLYTLLGVLDIYLLRKYAIKGPEEPSQEA